MNSDKRAGRWVIVIDESGPAVFCGETRETLETLTSFGDGGRQPSQFYGLHSIATDSQGNIYTTETWEGKRLQRFVNRGMAPVTTMHQGTVWPRR